MSQYGAQGAAEQGLTYRQIIDFYYPGTTWSEVTGGVRVLISADTTSDVVVMRTCPACGSPTSARDDLPLPDTAGVKRWRITVGAGSYERASSTSPARGTAGARRPRRCGRRRSSGRPAPADPVHARGAAHYRGACARPRRRRAARRATPSTSLRWTTTCAA